MSSNTQFLPGSAPIPGTPSEIEDAHQLLIHHLQKQSVQGTLDIERINRECHPFVKLIAVPAHSADSQGPILHSQPSSSGKPETSQRISQEPEIHSKMKMMVAFATQQALNDNNNGNSHRDLSDALILLYKFTTAAPTGPKLITAVFSTYGTTKDFEDFADYLEETYACMNKIPQRDGVPLDEEPAWREACRKSVFRREPVKADAVQREKMAADLVKVKKLIKEMSS
ncbi:MAG: hypothetical protein Q9168_004912, partial [Polycauliona sp. 1 TL-2023]